jgi:hypothetical protein
LLIISHVMQSEMAKITNSLLLTHKHVTTVTASVPNVFLSEWAYFTRILVNVLSIAVLANGKNRSTVTLKVVLDNHQDNLKIDGQQERTQMTPTVPFLTLHHALIPLRLFIPSFFFICSDYSQ